MATRPLFVSLTALAVAAGAMLLVWPVRSHTEASLQTHDPSGFPVQSFDFSYESQSHWNPDLPGAQAMDQGLSIHCESQGSMHLGKSNADDLTLLFEFTSVLCEGTDLLAERGLSRTIHTTREFLTSREAVVRASGNPAWALARSLFLHMDLGGRSRWSGLPQEFQQVELRLEGESTPTVTWIKDRNEVQWTKKFSGIVSRDDRADLTHSLQYQVGARSEALGPIEWGLVQLDGHEQSISMQKKNLVARTDIHTRVRRKSVRDREALSLLWAEAQLKGSGATPPRLRAADREKLLQNWRQFRDGAGVQPARGSSESNHDAYLELKQALRQDSSLAQDLAEDLNDLDPDSSAFATLAGALVYSGDAGALDVMVAAAQEHKDEREWQERALPMVGLAPAPTVQSWKYLDRMRQESTHPDLKSAAELGMGTHLKRGFKDAAFVSEIQHRLENAQTEDMRLHLLDVVGNTGLDQFFPLISSWLNGASLRLRVRIGQALRFMPRPEAEAVLLQLAADPALELALTALQSLRDRTLTAPAIPVLLQLLAQSPDDRIRLRILENLYAARALDADLLKKIQRLNPDLSFGPGLQAAWEQMEKDWMDPVET